MTGIPRAVVPYDPFRAIESDTVALLSDLPFANVKSSPYNATGDGVTDDTAAFVSLFSTAGNYWIPPGTYIVNGATLADLLLSNSFLRGSGEGITIIKAKDATDFQYLLYLSSKSNIVIEGITFDVNQANRSGQLTTTGQGIYLLSCTDIVLRNVTIKNAIGKGASSGPGFQATTCTRVRLYGCLAKDCGTVGNISDGFYMQGDECEFNGCIADTCLDTGFAMEACNDSGIVGCIAKNCGAGAAIVNNQNTDRKGNFIDGLAVQDWGSGTITGGVWIGSSGGSGNLVNTQVSGLLMTRTNGGGPAIRVHSVSTGRTVGLTLDNPRVQHTTGASVGTQAILVDTADDVEIDDPRVETTSNSNAIQVITTGSPTAVHVFGGRIKTGGAQGVSFDGVADCSVVGARIVGDGVHTTYGVYFFNACTTALVQACYVSGITVSEYGADGGTTLIPLTLTNAGNALMQEASISGGTTAAPSGRVHLGTTTAASAGADSGTYWRINIGGTFYKILLKADA